MTNNNSADAEIKKKLVAIKAKSKHNAKIMATKVKAQRGTPSMIKMAQLAQKFNFPQCLV